MVPPFTNVLDGRSLSISRGRRRVYDRVDIAFGPGVTAILGPNGAGKTTLLEGLLQPTQVGNGVVSLAGRRVPDELPVEAYLRDVGHMPQDWSYFPGFSVEESVAYTAWLKKMPAKQIGQAVTTALRRLELEEHRSTRIRRLSGGTRQRVGLAEAFVNEPRIVLLDEPTVGLDPAQRASFRRFVRDQGAARSVVLSTHLTDDVETLADRVVVIREGSVVFAGSPAQLAALACRSADVSSLEAGYLTVIGAGS